MKKQQAERKAGAKTADTYMPIRPIAWLYVLLHDFMSHCMTIRLIACLSAPLHGFMSHCMAICPIAWLYVPLHDYPSHCMTLCPIAWLSVPLHGYPPHCMTLCPIAAMAIRMHSFSNILSRDIFSPLRVTTLYSYFQKKMSRDIFFPRECDTRKTKTTLYCTRIVEKVIGNTVHMSCAHVVSQHQIGMGINFTCSK